MQRLPDECDDKDCLFHPVAKKQLTLNEQHAVMKKTGLFETNWETSRPLTLQQNVEMWNYIITQNDYAVQIYAANSKEKDTYTPRTWNHAFVLFCYQLSHTFGRQ